MDNNEYHHEAGWNEDHENIQRLLEVTARIAELRYEILNCMRGSYFEGLTDDPKSIAEACDGLANELQHIAAEID